MNPFPLLLSIFAAVLAFSPSLRAQNLPATLLLQDQTALKGSLLPRRVGTTQLQFTPEGTQSTRVLSTAEIKLIQFDLSRFDPENLRVQYKAAKYGNVIEKLKGRIIPYFSFVDMEANSNPLVEKFIQSLYREGNYAGVHAAGMEVAKFDANGPVRRLADIYRALSFLEQGDLEKYAAYASYFREIKREDPLAPALWMGQAKLARLQERPDREYPLLARIIIENPMDTEWSAEALYLTAVHHHTRTNLVVANQICQEIRIVAPLTHWPEEAEKLQRKIKTLAEELNVELVDFGEFRRAEKEAGEAEIDYRKRQRELEEQQIQFTE